jgi:hypothetical protein
VNVSLVVPWRSGDPWRERIWTWCRTYWEATWPEFELIECDSEDEPFTRGRSLNAGVEKASGEILVLADADTVVAHVGGAVEMATYGDWVIAYPEGQYYSLTEHYTADLTAGPPGRLREPTREQWRDRITSYSGVLVLLREAFDKVGGYDPRFIGWGHEDFAFMFALDTLWKPHQRATGWALHLWHEHREPERFEQPHIAENKALVDRYEHCYANPSAMSQLVRER